MNIKFTIQCEFRALPEVKVKIEQIADEMI
jgi:hypothetical protein